MMHMKVIQGLKDRVNQHREISCEIAVLKDVFEKKDDEELIPLRKAAIQREKDTHVRLTQELKEEKEREPKLDQAKERELELLIEELQPELNEANEVLEVEKATYFA